jgi:acyl dehydratase
MTGKWFDELQVGQVFKHDTRRTITAFDITWFASATFQSMALCLDNAFTLGLMAGVAGPDTVLGTSVANLGWDEVQFPQPVNAGDTLHFETEVLDLRPSRSRQDQGIVIWIHRAYNQRDELVAKCRRAGLQRKIPS